MNTVTLSSPSPLVMLAIGLADTHVVAVLDLEATLREVINPEIRTEIHPSHQTREVLDVP